MRNPPSILLAVLTLASLACSLSFTLPSVETVSGSGRVVERTFDLSGFDQVEINYAFTATVEQGQAHSVRIRIDDNLEPYLRVERVGTRLIVGLDPERMLSLRSATLEAEITMPALAAAEANGASRLHLSGFSGQGDLRLAASGASTLRGEVEARDVTLLVSGASNASLTGGGRNLTLEVSGASRAALSGFTCATVRAAVSGASTAHVHATERLDVEASGASTVTYVGSPVLGTTEISGGSSLRRE
jgi:hypothetical protein